MAEAGNPAMAEMQPQRPATRLQDRLGNWARETFTPTGRAEVMAQKQIDAILAQVPEDKRVEAMQMLEAKRSDIVAGKMEDAKGSLVRDAVIGTAVLGGLTGAVIWRKEIGGAGVKMGKAVFERMPDRMKPGMVQVGRRVEIMQENLGAVTSGLKNRVDGAMSRILRRKTVQGEMPINLGKLFKDIEDKALDALNIKYPVLKMGVEINDTLRDAVESKLANDFERELAGNFLKLAKRHGEWVPFIIEKLTDVVDGGPRLNKNYDTMINRGFANKKVLGDGTVIIAPTQAFVGFVKKHLVS